MKIEKQIYTHKVDELYDKAYEWVINNGPKIIVGLIILIVGLWLIKMLKSRIRRHMSNKEVHSSLQPFFLSVSITGLNILLVVIVLQIMGIGVTLFTTIFGALTVAAGLALSGTFQNFAGGILILLLKPFDLDDSILAQGQDGKVISIQIFYTVLLTADNKTVIIPNGKLFNEVITNVTREGKRRLDFELKLEYAVDVDKVKEVIYKSIKKTKNVLSTPATNVGVIALELDGIRFTVRVWVEPANFLSAKLELQENVIKDLKAAGIKLPGVILPVAPPAVEEGAEDTEEKAT
ncbi:mechanosensitive ion channel family protein [Mucilaginibacter boryungensis]|uniref:Mechanosensitive ion channel family protein n=1 Tax=Mucilaginibacter boryungensis TaxID=768480 RepID=A0ABR9XCQ2_9SPHI|nr:mechanosensitive ion channel family protein [Mucilaginibacter boryungensis]MBE9664759.1 mechanosensitive ion channel family protein [Mucilaginibacter boryungensis]